MTTTLIFADSLLILVSLLLLLYFKPIIGILGIVAGTCFLYFHGYLPLTNIGSIHLPDIILLILFFVLFLRTRVSPGYKFVKTPLDKPLIILFVVGLVKLLVTNNKGMSDFLVGFHEFKVLGYYLLAILVTNFARDEKDLKRLIYGIWLIACIGSFLVITRGFTSSTVLRGSVEEIFYAHEYMAGGSNNILILWSLCCLFSLVLIKGIRLKYLSGLGICLLYFMLMYQRHMYTAISFSFLVISMLVIKRYKSRLLVIILIGVLAVFSISTAYMFGPSSLKKYLEMSEQRLLSMKDFKGSNSLEYRKIENGYAIETIKDHPIFGIGFQRAYRPAVWGPDDVNLWFLHNGFLWIFVKMGILGFIPFVWISLVFIKRSLNRWESVSNDFYRAIVVGSIGAYIGLGLVNYAGAYFIQDWGVAMFGMFFGLNESIFALKSRKDTGEPA